MARMTKAMASAFENRVSNELAAQRNRCREVLTDTINNELVNLRTEYQNKLKQVDALLEKLKTAAN